jgi:hypothetical protein
MFAMKSEGTSPPNDEILLCPKQMGVQTNIGQGDGT